VPARVHGSWPSGPARRRCALELPHSCADALRLHRDRQDQLRERAGERWHDNDLVFASRVGTALLAGNVRRSFRAVLATAGLDPADWTPQELRHSFVSLMSDAGVPIEKIARLVGHTGTTTTETVYRKQIRPVVVGGAGVMDSLFPKRDADA
jgi:integrase